MSAKVRTTEGIAISKLDSKPSNPISSNSSNNQIEIEIAKCDCCALIEECTPAYIAKIRERYNGRWICGLCSEAVKDEICRSKRLISTEEALNRHMSFSKSFKSSPMKSTEELISVMRQLLRRSLDSPRAVRSTPASPRRKSSQISLPRSDSCFSTIATFARYAERTAFERPLTSGVAYAVKVLHHEREEFEKQQGWTIKKMDSQDQAPARDYKKR